MSFVIDKDNDEVNFKFSIKIKDLVRHLENRCGLSEKNIRDYFEENDKIFEKYVKLCSDLTEGHVKDGLDEIEDVIEFAENVERKVERELRRPSR